MRLSFYEGGTALCQMQELRTTASRAELVTANDLNKPLIIQPVWDWE